MEWTGEGVVIGTRRHGESSVILEVMTPAHGRCMGLVRGGRSRRQQPTLQPGNLLQLNWRARLDNHLGTFTVEPLRMRAAELMASPLGVYGVQTLAALLRLLPERDPHPSLYNAFEVVLEHIDEPLIAGALIVRLELQLLGELGFGLDLSQCAASGVTDDLIWVSPKSGRAVCRAAGAPYAAKLLPLPAFLRARQSDVPSQIDLQALNDAFRLTSFFLYRHVWEPRGLTVSDARDGLINHLRKALNEPAT